MSVRRLAFAAAGVVAALLLAWLAVRAWRAGDAPPAAGSPAARTSPAPAAASPPAAPEPAASALAAAPSAPAPCPHQTLEITLADRVVFGCVGETRESQTGSIRSFVVEPEGLSRWRLRVDVAGSDVIGTLLVGAGGPLPEPEVAYSCTQDCTGLQYVGPDARGAWHVQARQAVLHADAAGPKSGARVQLSATLRVAARGADGADCAVPSVTMIENGSASSEVCPSNGAGFEIQAGGDVRYRFLDAHGRVLTVDVGGDGAIRKAQVGAYACAAPQCGGLTMRVTGRADSIASERRFDFSGVTVFASGGGPGRSATLNGSVVMPSQE